MAHRTGGSQRRKISVGYRPVRPHFRGDQNAGADTSVPVKILNDSRDTARFDVEQETGTACDYQWRADRFAHGRSHRGKIGNLDEAERFKIGSALAKRNQVRSGKFLEAGAPKLVVQRVEHLGF